MTLGCLLQFGSTSGFLQISRINGFHAHFNCGLFILTLFELQLDVFEIMVK
jgi:hypothetical protein